MSMPLHTYIDHTLLKPDATAEDIEKLCLETVRYQFASACIHPYWVKFARKLLPEAKLCSVVGFPLGANTTETKSAETHQLISLGVDEVDMVLNIGALRAKDYLEVKQDIESVVKAAGTALVKVIIETCLLTDEEKRIASLLCVEAGAHFVKTSTGFSKAGATIHDVALLRNTVGSAIGVKASAGIRDQATALAMIEAGATRIGTSSGVMMIEHQTASLSSY